MAPSLKAAFRITEAHYRSFVTLTKEVSQVSIEILHSASSVQNDKVALSVAFVILTKEESHVSIGILHSANPVRNGRSRLSS